jgi:hypothetical protein
VAQTRTWRIAGVSLLALLLTACVMPTPEAVTVRETVIVAQEVEVTRVVEVTREVEVTKEVVVTAAPEPTAVQRVLLEDDFEPGDPGWDLMQVAWADRSIEGGRLNMTITELNAMVWTTNVELESVDDFELEVDATMVGGPIIGSYGIVFRAQDVNNWYSFLISGDGKFQLACLYDNAGYSIVDWTPMAAVKGPGSVNHLRLVVDGPQIGAYVNGELLAIVPVNVFRRGDIGLAAATPPDERGVTVTFDNLRVTGLD